MGHFELRTATDEDWAGIADGFARATGGGSAAAVFLIFSPATAVGRQSATAAAKRKSREVRESATLRSLTVCTMSLLLLPRGCL